MSSENKILLGLSGDAEIGLYTKMANRHGMIAGATGTGKTVTLKVMAEEFSALGVPVFLADIKGDLSGMCAKRRKCRQLPNLFLGCLRRSRYSAPCHRF